MEEFYDQFEDEMSELIFHIQTEMRGRNKRTLHEACEQVNLALHGLEWDKLADDEYEDLPYDKFFMENCDLTAQVMERMIKRYAEGF